MYQLPDGRWVTPLPAMQPEPCERERHVSLQMGITPSLALDVDYKLFYGFANVSLVFPAATDGIWVSLTTGLGVNFKLHPRTRWKMEVFGMASAMRLDVEQPWIGSMGIGVGFHYTSGGGFTIGFKIPIFGYSFSSQRMHGGEALAFYYLASATSLPFVSMGYRF